MKLNSQQFPAINQILKEFLASTWSKNGYDIYLFEIKDPLKNASSTIFQP
jgi:hypothetical protein